MLFKDVLVEEPLKRQLVNLVKNNRISHAQLFLSQAGNHAFALAVAYAQYLSCEDRKEWDSCGVCPSCVKFEKLAHPDFHMIFPNTITKTMKKDPDSKQLSREFRAFVMENNYHIDLEKWLQVLGGENKQASINIRDCANIINQNSIRSYEGGYKIYLLWMVERLYHTAAPKLLKTLEEPENKTLFILLTENTDKILPTILSRTQLIKIPCLSDQTVAGQLSADFGIAPDIASDIAMISEGNYCKAISLFHEREELNTMLSDFEMMMNSMLALAKGNIQECRFTEVQAMFASWIGKGREVQKSFLSFIIRIYRDILLFNTRNTALVRATSQEKKILEVFHPYVGLKNIGQILNECNQALYHIERNGNPGIIFTDLYLKLSRYLVLPATA